MGLGQDLLPLGLQEVEVASYLEDSYGGLVGVEEDGDLVQVASHFESEVVIVYVRGFFGLPVPNDVFPVDLSLLKH